jgi:uncharacterized RDD family membrane protein YckC
MPMVAETARPPTRVHVAGFWRRAAAGVVDGLILTLVFGLLGLLGAVILRRPLPRWSQLGPDYVVDLAFNGSVVAETGLLLLGILGFLYFFIFHTTRGQTPGKRLLVVRVIDAYGVTPSAGRTLLRTIGYVPSLLFLALGFFWIGFDREKRGLHDWLADTYVVRERGARGTAEVTR